jgi:hypothetical protein
MKAFFTFRAGLIPLLLALTACHEDDFPDSKISSRNLDTHKISQDFRIQAQDSELDEADNGVHVSVSLYRKRSDGIIQFVDLAPDEKLELTSEDMQPLLLDKNYYPSERDRQAVDYSAQIPEIIAGKEYTLNFNRGSATPLSSYASVLQITPFTVAPSTTPLTAAGKLTLTWTPVTDYDYEVSFRFSCGANKDQYVQSISFPNRSANTDPVSPFVFTFDDYFEFPAEATDCQLRATLWSYQDQSELGDSALDNVNITSVRVQRISTAIQKN